MISLCTSFRFQICCVCTVPCLQDTLPKDWFIQTCVNGELVEDVSAANSRDVFGDDIYWSAIFGSALLDEKVWLGRRHEKVSAEHSNSK